ncbi:MAG: response regulator [Myxococcales bacterium]|nr:response regulator [Myxococcales bacterium]
MASSENVILLVDPDKKSRRVLEVSLKKAGYSVHSAENAKKALQSAAESPVSLVIADTELEDMSGFDFCAQLKESAEVCPPFIFLTQSHDMGDKLKGYELGVEEYIAKPVFVKEVLERVQVLLERREDAAEAESRAEESDGDLANFSVLDLLETVESGKKTGSLALTSGQQTGQIYFKAGHPVDAVTKPLVGEDALFRMIGWTQGHYTLKYVDTIDRPARLQGTFSELAEEGVQRLEESERLIQTVGDMETVMRVDYAQLGKIASDLPSAIEAFVDLFDGRRSLTSIVTESELGDLESIQAVVRLYEEGVLDPVSQANAVSEAPAKSGRKGSDLVTWLTGEHAAIGDAPKSLDLGDEERREAIERQKAQEAERIQAEAARKEREEAERKAAEEEACRKAEEEELQAELDDLRKEKEAEERRLEEKRAALAAREEAIIKRLTGEHSAVEPASKGLELSDSREVAASPSASSDVGPSGTIVKAKRPEKEEMIAAAAAAAAAESGSEPAVASARAEDDLDDHDDFFSSHSSEYGAYGAPEAHHRPNKTPMFIAIGLVVVLLAVAGLSGMFSGETDDDEDMGNGPAVMASNDDEGTESGEPTPENEQVQEQNTDNTPQVAENDTPEQPAPEVDLDSALAESKQGVADAFNNADSEASMAEWSNPEAESAVASAVEETPRSRDNDHEDHEARVSRATEEPDDRPRARATARTLDSPLCAPEHD